MYEIKCAEAGPAGQHGEPVDNSPEDQTAALEQEQDADEEEEDEEEDEGRTVKITAVIRVDKGVVMNELKDIIFGDLDDVKEVVDFDWEDVK